MLKARHDKEIVVKVRNRIGRMFEISKLISEKGISILAVHGAVDGEQCAIRLVTDDNLRAKEALAAHGIDATEEGVILVEVPHKPGMLKRITEVLADAEIDIAHLYATATVEQDRCLVVLHTSSDAAALPRLTEPAVQ